MGMLMIPTCTVRSTFGSMVITVLDGGLWCSMLDSRKDPPAVLRQALRVT